MSVGTWAQDGRWGWGELRTKSGQVMYKGEWQQDLRHGRGWGLCPAEPCPAALTWILRLIPPAGVAAQGLLLSVSATVGGASGRGLGSSSCPATASVEGTMGRHGWLVPIDYEGILVNDQAHGPGSASYSNGMKYTGEFVEGLPCGSGTLALPWGDTYEVLFSSL